MQVKCDFCGSMIDDTLEKCPNCGAPNQNMHRMADDEPKTIEELKQWYAARNLPPYETTRFFIGIDYKQPRAFGIYRDGENVIVYKNKNDGSRAVRYKGTDEAYAVNEILLKLKSEILHQKAGNISRNSTEKESRLSKWLWRLLAVVFLAPGLVFIFAPSTTPTYYDYDNTVYCSYGSDYYVYDTYDNDYSSVNTSEVPSEIIDSPETYAIDSSSLTWKDDYDFTESNYYSENISSSDDDYDWDSGSDSWDSSSSDFDSDW